jgi:hypothetical protein
VRAGIADPVTDESRAEAVMMDSLGPHCRNQMVKGQTVTKTNIKVIESQLMVDSFAK